MRLFWIGIGLIILALIEAFVIADKFLIPASSKWYLTVVISVIIGYVGGLSIWRVYTDTYKPKRGRRYYQALVAC